MKKLFFFILFTVITAGCAVYEPVEIVPDHIRNIYIAPFENESHQLGLSEELTSQVTNDFIRNGRFSVVSREDADSILRGSIVEYKRIPISFDENFIAEEYSLSMAVDLSFTDRIEKQVLWKEEWDELKGGIEARVRYYVGSDRAFTESEESARERLIEEMSDIIVRRTVYGWK
ncbi:MAG: LptE family protein [Elusimicrobiota bacterium]